MSDSENSISPIQKVRKDRIHPYTKRLNNIKAKINYYKNKLIKENSNDKYKNIINDLEYERFILKLNDKDIKTIKTFCKYNNIDFIKLCKNIKEI